MFDHLSVGVESLDRAAAFYDAALAPLGYVRLWDNARSAGYGPSGFEGEAPFAIIEVGHAVTHGDLGPWNMLARDGRFAGVIDWDLARFGLALDDLAEAAFELGPLRPNDEMLPADAYSDERVYARIGALCRGYGEVAPRDVLDHVAPLYEARIAELRRLAAQGRAPFVALAAAGHSDALADDLRAFRKRWTRRGASE